MQASFQGGFTALTSSVCNEGEDGAIKTLIDLGATDAEVNLEEKRHHKTHPCVCVSTQLQRVCTKTPPPIKGDVGGWNKDTDVGNCAVFWR